MTLAPGVELPPAVRCVLSILRSAGLVAHSRVPNPRPNEFHIVRRLGGIEQTPVSDGPLVTVETWAADDSRAEELSQTVRTVIHSAKGHQHNGTLVYRVAGVGGPAPLPDPDGSPQIRWVQQFALHLRST